MTSLYLVIAERVIEQQNRPLTAKAIIDIAQKQGLLSDKISGRTPFQTLKSKLSVHIRKEGDKSVFVRTAPGRFYLRSLLEDSERIYHARPIVPPPTNEQVLVFSTSWLDSIGRFQGISGERAAIVEPIVSGDVTKYLNRLDAEQDDETKQVLTYVMITRSDEVLSFRRGTYNRAANFLRGSYCVGFGGHVTSEDRDLFDADRMGIYRCASRELSEELVLPDSDLRRLERMEGLRLRGLLNDDSSAVGRRHFAFLLEYRVAEPEEWDRPARGEKAITNLQWLNASGKQPRFTEFEYWSQLCLLSYFPYISSGRPDYHIRRRQPLKPPHVLCVLGEIGSGKSETTRVLKEHHGYTEVNSGRVLAKLLGVAPVPATPRVKFQRLAYEFISQRDGPERLAKAILVAVTETGSTRVVVDGIRQVATLNALRKHASPMRVGVLYVHTPPHVAFEFFETRRAALGAASSTIREFLDLRSSPVEQEVGDMISGSDAVLYNWSGLTRYRLTISELLREVGS